MFLSVNGCGRQTYYVTKYGTAAVDCAGIQTLDQPTLVLSIVRLLLDGPAFVSLPTERVSESERQ